jgi:N-acetylmuramoyl-L-alanine amidase
MKIEEKFLTKNQFSRPGMLLKGVHGIVVHWVGNPKSTAVNNRNYFECLKSQAYETEKEQKKARFASAHFVVGMEGEAIQCIPENEMAYHVGAKEYKPSAIQNLGTYPNNSTLGIELCHPDWSGRFNTETLDATCRLITDLLERHKLSKKDVYRHFDITGKDCPLYFVEHGDAWHEFVKSIIFPKS